MLAPSLAVLVLVAGAAAAPLGSTTTTTTTATVNLSRKGSDPNYDYLGCYDSTVISSKVTPMQAFYLAYDTLPSLFQRTSSRNLTIWSTSHEGNANYGSNLCISREALAEVTPLDPSKCTTACRKDANFECGGTSVYASDVYIAKNAYCPPPTTAAAPVVSTPAAVNATSPVTNSSVPATVSSPVSVNTTTSTTNSSVLPSPTASSTKLSSKDWTYNGCVADFVNGARSLPNYLTVGKWDVETCVAAADAAGYAVAGVIAGGECWASNALSPYATKLDNSTCNWTCGDNKNLTCGGQTSLDVYTSTKRAVSTGPTEAQVKTVGEWKYDACYSDSTAQRSLPNQLSSSNQTVEGCLNQCAKSGARVCGLSYYGECWSSTTDIATYAKTIDESSCRYPCAGNSLEMCGGSNALGVWRNTAPFPTTTTTTVVVTPTPSIVQKYVSKANWTWTYSACYSDLVNGRALSNGLTTTSRTIEACLEACQKADYKLCGIEYHGECWGGNTLGAGSTPQGDAACGLTCWDNPLQICGGQGGVSGATFQLYNRSDPTGSIPPTPSTTVIATPTPTGPAKLSSKNWTYQGCVADLVNGGRSLPNYLTVGKWDVETCVAAADAAGYAVAGVIAGGECWASNALSPYATKLDNSTCNWTCGDNKNFTCGGQTSLDVYVSNNRSPLTGPTDADVESFGNYKYHACYSDSTAQRSLPDRLDNSNKTVEGCLNACASSNATVCGLSYYGECWSSSTDIASSAQVIADLSCSTVCAGNSLETCGGSNALSVWRFDNSTSTAPTVEIPSEPFTLEKFRVDGWHYEGCRTETGIYDGAVFNVIDYVVEASEKSVQACMAAGRAKGYETIGVENGGEKCWAMEQGTHGSIGTFLEESSCNTPCVDAPEYTCGGKGTLDVYIVARMK